MHDDSPERIKILYTNFHAGDGGGHTTYLASLAALLARKHEIHVAAPRSSKLFRLVQAMPGVRTLPMEFGGNPLGGQWLELRRYLHQHDFDIVHVNGAADHRQTMLALIGLHRPGIVFTKHNSKPCDSLGNRIRARLATDHVIAVSAHTRQLLRHSPYRIRPIDVVYNGIDVETFSPCPMQQAASERARWIGDVPLGLLLGSSAGTAAYKGWMDLLEALTLLPMSIREQIHVLIAGKMPNADTLARVAELGMEARVHFTGLLEDVRPMIAAIDAGFVLSYDIETISFACREMMSMGKPVLVSDYAGLPENISSGRDGWVVPARDRTAIAALVAQMYTNRASLPAMGDAARARAVNAFNLQRFCEGTEAVYRRVLAGTD